MNPFYAGLAALGLLVALVFGVGRWEAKIEQRGYDRAQAEYGEKAVAAGAREREEEIRRVAAQRKAEDESNQKIEAARIDAARADAAVVSLRKRIAELTSNRGVGLNFAPVSDGATTAALGELFANCAERYSVMGREADAARNAGQRCEGQYDALIKPTIREQVTRLRGNP